MLFIIPNKTKGLYFLLYQSVISLNISIYLEQHLIYSYILTQRNSNLTKIVVLKIHSFVDVNWYFC